MKTLEEELTFVDNDSDLLNIDTQIEFLNSPIQGPQVSPYDSQQGNPMISSQNNVAKAFVPKVLSQGPWNEQKAPPTKSNPLQGTPYGREEGYRVRRRVDAVPLPDVTQHTKRQPMSTPVLVQQVVQSPLYVNLPPGSFQQISDVGGSLVKIDSSQIHQQTSLPTSQPLLIQNNSKGVTPFILNSNDGKFSPLILQSNIIAPETQTLVYTTAPVQGKVNNKYFKNNTIRYFLLNHTSTIHYNYYLQEHRKS